MLKLDLEKAYDKVNWAFLRLVLLHIGFSLKMVNWIMVVVSSTNFVVLIKGMATHFFQAQRGTRQGCLLSPLLFLIIANGLSRILGRDEELKEIRGINLEEFLKLLILRFVDDIFLFGKGSPQE